MLLALFASLAFGASKEVVVRIDDRAARKMTEPKAALVYWDGQRVDAMATDDGGDPDDQFAGDKLWIARIPAAGSGHAWVVVTDESEAARAAREPPLVSAIVIDPDDQPQRVVVAASTRASVEATRGETRTGPGLDEEPTDGPRPMPDDYPLSPGAALTETTENVESWTAATITAGLSILAAIALMIAFAREGVTTLGARLRLLGAPLLARFGPAPRWVAWFPVITTAAVVLSIWAPALPWLVTDFLGIEYVDHYGTQWFYWYVDYSQREHIFSDTAKMFFYPWGKDIYKHTGANVLDAWAALPFRRGLGAVLGYNVFVLVNVVLAGIAFYLVAREVTEDRIAAGVAAALYTTQPFLLIELQEGRPTQGLTLLPVLFVLCVLRASRRRGLLYPLAGGVLLALTGYQYWFYAMFGGLFALVYGLWAALKAGPEAGGPWRTLSRFVLMGLVAMAAVAPEAAPMVVATSEGDKVPGLLDTDKWSVFTTPPITQEGFRIGLFSWQPLRQALGFLVIDDQDNERFLAQTIAFPWSASLVLVAWYWRPGRLTRGLVLTLALVLALIAIGPVLLVGSNALPNPVYIYLVKSVGFLRRLWWPSRCLLFLVMLLSMLTASSVAWLRTQRAVVQVFGFAGFALWWGWDLHRLNVLPFPTWDATVPAGYRCLAADKEGAIIELPYAFNQAHLYFQTVHEHPLLGGMLEDNPTFTPEEFTEFRTTSPMVSRLLAGDPIGQPYDWDDSAAVEVHNLGYKYLVVQKDAFYMPEDEGGAINLFLLLWALREKFGAPVFEDGRIAIYSPWDDGPPCDISSVTPDPAPTGPTEQRQQIREPNRDKQLFTRWLKDPDADLAAELEVNSTSASQDSTSATGTPSSATPSSAAPSSAAPSKALPTTPTSTR